MICSSGVGFDPHHNGRRLSFGFHGIWQGTAVLYDQETRSLWLHLTGESIRGPLKGTRLTPIPMRHVTWKQWRTEHPDSEVMNQDPRRRSDYFDFEQGRRGVDWFPPFFTPTIQTRDDRLPPSALCLGIDTPHQSRAYPFATLATIPSGLVHDTVGNVPIVVVFDAETGSATAHGRLLGGRARMFERTPEGLLRDVESGSLFDRDGVGQSGPDQGQQLPSVFGLQAEWYGWYAAHPDTTIWEGTSEER